MWRKFTEWGIYNTTDQLLVKGSMFQFLESKSGDAKAWSNSLAIWKVMAKLFLDSVKVVALLYAEIFSWFIGSLHCIHLPCLWGQHSNAFFVGRHLLFS